MRGRFTFALCLAAGGCLMAPPAAWVQSLPPLHEILEEGQNPPEAPLSVEEPQPATSSSISAASESDLPGPQVEGLRCTHPFYGFSIEAPNPDWRFLTDPQTVRSFNEDALFIVNAPDLGLYSMVILEELPDVTIEDYADRVQPSLEDLTLKTNEPISLEGGLPAWRQTWEGTYDNLAMRFHYTLVAKEMYRIQIVSWCAKSNWSDEVENQFHSLGLSFRDVAPAMMVKKPTWRPPAQIAPEDRYHSPRHGFSLVRPSADWTFVTSREELDSINPHATVLLHENNQVFSMVIVEPLPEMSLMEYASKAVPNLEGATLVEEEEAILADVEARRRRWRGKFDGTPFDFFYALLDVEGLKVQMVSWCSTSLLDDNIRTQIRYIEESFSMDPERSY